MNDLPPDSHRLDPQHHPTPFSAEQIREASRPGTVVTYRIEPADGGVHLDRWEFLGGDEIGGRRRRWTETLDGHVIDDPVEVEARWVDLQRHASYPVATTRLTTGSVVTPGGEFDCWVYVIANDDGTITKASFARDQPGPPVHLETTEDGEVLFRMTLVDAERT